jgi:hypothetical protein
MYGSAAFRDASTPYEPGALQKQQRESRERILDNLPAVYRARLIYSDELTKCTDARQVHFLHHAPHEPSVEADVARTLQCFLDESSRTYVVYFLWMLGYDRSVMLYFQSL